MLVVRSVLVRVEALLLPIGLTCVILLVVTCVDVVAVVCEGIVELLVDVFGAMKIVDDEDEVTRVELRGLVSVSDDEEDLFSVISDGPRDPLRCFGKGGLEVTLNDGGGDRCLIGMGAKVSWFFSSSDSSLSLSLDSSGVSPAREINLIPALPRS